MSYYTISLLAGVDKKIPVIGRLLLVDTTGEATGGVDITLTDPSGKDLPKMPTRKAGFRIVEMYESVTFNSTVDATIGIFLSMNDVQLGGNQIVNDTANPVPVDILTPITLTASSVQVNNTPAQAIPVTLHNSDDTVSIPTTPYLAAAIADTAPAAITAAASAIVFASATRRGLRMKNNGGNPVALGGAGVTFANAAVVIQPGETWNENEAPGAAWYGICDTGLSSSINILTIT